MVLGLLSAVLSVSLVQDQAVEIPFRIGEDAIIVDAKVNGKDVSLMFDSGFSGAFVIGPHLNLGKPTGKMGLKDFVGVFEADTIDVKSVELGEFKIQPEEMQIVQLPTLSYTQSYGTHVDGIMGLEVFADRVTEINFEKKMFIVHPDSHDITALQPDNKKTFLSKMLPIGNTSIEMEARASNGKRFILALDTGNAFYATTHKDVLQKNGLWKSGVEPEFMGQAMIASGPVDSWSLLLEDMKVFGVPVESAVWDIIDLPASSAQHNGTVGFGFLKHFNITIDMQRRRVWLDNFDGKTSEEPMGEVGIAATYSEKDKRMVIVSVTPNGPAQKAGVERGDFLVTIDRKQIVRSSYRQIRSILLGKPGTEVELELSRKGQLQKLTLKRVLLVNRVRN